MLLEGSTHSLTYPSVRKQICDKPLRMVVDLVFGGPATSQRGDVRIIAVDQHPCLYIFKELWQQVCGPEDVRGGACPGVVRVAVQSMDEDDIHESRVGGRRCIDLGQSESLDGFVHGTLQQAR